MFWRTELRLRPNEGRRGTCRDFIQLSNQFEIRLQLQQSWTEATKPWTVWRSIRRPAIEGCSEWTVDSHLCFTVDGVRCSLCYMPLPKQRQLYYQWVTAVWSDPTVSFQSGSSFLLLTKQQVLQQELTFLSLSLSPDLVNVSAVFDSRPSSNFSRFLNRLLLLSCYHELLCLKSLVK